MELYRYYDTREIRYEYDRDVPAKINLETIPVIRETEKSYVVMWESKEKFILKSNDQHGRRFAYANKEWAMHSFKKRKQHQLAYLQRDLDHVNTILALIEDHQDG